MLVVERKPTFEGCQIVLLLQNFGFKRKKELNELIINNGGVISYIVNKKTTHVVLSEAELLDSYKCRQARKYDIAMVSLDWLWDSAEHGLLQELGPYLLEKRLNSLQFDHGKIKFASDGDKKAKKKKGTVIPAQVKVHRSLSDIQAPYPSSYQIAKWIILCMTDKKMTESYAVLEAHVAAQEQLEQDNPRYRIYLSHASLDHLQNGKEPEVEVRYVKTSEDALAVFMHVYHKLHSSTQHVAQILRLPAHCHQLGSPLFQQMQQEMMWRDTDLDPEVRSLVKVIWDEAQATTEVLSLPVIAIKPDQIDKAEVILQQLSKAIKENSGENELQELSEKFYEQLPHKTQHHTTLNHKRDVVVKQDLCQVIRDLVECHEGTGLFEEQEIIAKYQALRCNIAKLSPDSSHYKKVNDLFSSTLKETHEKSRILNIFHVRRAVEDANFRDDIHNKQLLFHSSSPSNFVGIFSRGLLLPKNVVEDLGGVRSDAGNLGSGIYFADKASTSLGYSRASKKGSRLVGVFEVSLGKVYQTHERDLTLTAPPPGYHSVHGVASKSTSSSHFTDDEFAIYSVNQQRLQYVVEVTLPHDKVTDVIVMATDEANLDPLIDDQHYSSSNKSSGYEEMMKQVAERELESVKKLKDPMMDVKAGLQGQDDAVVPLRGVHIRAKMVDLAAQVVVLQEYKNESSVPIEAKYVFPLDDMAAVCGFEAFINGKHVVGKVKEKEVAHREYREAISKGHGAYLMDQEKPDVFTVSVGNLPAGASVLIKITYVAELLVDGENIRLTIPASVAPWQKDPSLSQVTQKDVKTVKIKEQQGKVSLQVSVDMPFDIRHIHSPTHPIKMKKTASKATVELPRGSDLGEGFTLEVSLAEVHVPRMWVEAHPETASRACMLTFYPEFETELEQDPHVTLLMDVSSSMSHNYDHAIKLALLAIDLLPDNYYFNIMVFGSTYTSLFIQHQKKSQASVDQAAIWLARGLVCMGNTDVWRPLQSLGLLPPCVNSMNNVFLISDGHLNNEGPTLEAMSKNADKARIFTLGVGSNCNQHVLRKAAQLGCGTYQYFDPSAKSKWKGKLETLLEQAAQPGLSSVSVQWQQHNDYDPEPLQAPQVVTSVFSGARVVVYGFVENCLQAELRAKVGSEEVNTIVSTTELAVHSDTILHTLTARAVIQDWENGLLHNDKLHNDVLKEKRKDLIIDLSKKYSLVTQFTSFVAIEEREEGEEKVDGPSLDELVAKETVDSLDYLGWQVLPPEEEETDVRVGRMLKEAVIAESYSLAQAEEHCSSLLSLLPDVSDPNLKSQVKKHLQVFYTDVSAQPLQVQNLLKIAPDDINVYVRTLTGKGKTITAEVKENTSVAHMKNIINDKEGLPPDQQGLVFQGVHLGTDADLADYGIKDGDTIYLILKLRGGSNEKAVYEDDVEEDEEAYSSSSPSCVTSGSAISGNEESDFDYQFCALDATESLDSPEREILEEPKMFANLAMKTAISRPQPVALPGSSYRGGRGRGAWTKQTARRSQQSEISTVSTSEEPVDFSKKEKKKYKMVKHRAASAVQIVAESLTREAAVRETAPLQDEGRSLGSTEGSLDRDALIIATDSSESRDRSRQIQPMLASLQEKEPKTMVLSAAMDEAEAVLCHYVEMEPEMVLSAVMDEAVSQPEIFDYCCYEEQKVNLARAEPVSDDIQSVKVIERRWEEEAVIEAADSRDGRSADTRKSEQPSEHRPADMSDAKRAPPKYAPMSPSYYATSANLREPLGGASDQRTQSQLQSLSASSSMGFGSVVSDSTSCGDALDALIAPEKSSPKPQELPTGFAFSGFRKFAAPPPPPTGIGSPTGLTSMHKELAAGLAPPAFAVPPPPAFSNAPPPATGFKFGSGTTSLQGGLFGSSSEVAFASAPPAFATPPPPPPAGIAASATGWGFGFGKTSLQGGLFGRSSDDAFASAPLGFAAPPPPAPVAKAPATCVKFGSEATSEGGFLPRPSVHKLASAPPAVAAPPPPPPADIRPPTGLKPSAGRLTKNSGCFLPLPPPPQDVSNCLLDLAPSAFSPQPFKKLSRRVVTEMLVAASADERKSLLMESTSKKVQDKQKDLPFPAQQFVSIGFAQQSPISCTFGARMDKPAQLSAAAARWFKVLYKVNTAADELASVVIKLSSLERSSYSEAKDMSPQLGIHWEALCTLLEECGAKSLGESGFYKLLCVVVIELALILLELLSPTVPPHRLDLLPASVKAFLDSQPTWYSTLELANSHAQLVCDMTEAFKQVYNMA